jgi:hypothetical protein
MRLLFILHVFLLALAGCSTPAGASDLPPLSSSAPDSLVAGHKLYVAKCARCHKFYDPASYSDAKWHEWMDKMSKKAKLKADQKEILSQYLDTFRSGKTDTSQPTPKF